MTCRLRVAFIGALVVTACGGITDIRERASDSGVPGTESGGATGILDHGAGATDDVGIPPGAGGYDFGSGGYYQYGYGGYQYGYGGYQYGYGGYQYGGYPYGGDGQYLGNGGYPYGGNGQYLGNGGYPYGYGGYGYGGGGCCLAIPVCDANQVQIPGQEACTNGGCITKTTCCTTIWCQNADNACIPHCAAGDEQVPSCPQNLPCYQTTSSCGVTVGCIVPVDAGSSDDAAP